MNYKRPLLLLVAVLATTQLFADWLAAPPEHLVSNAHVVATGRVVKVSLWDKSETIMLGDKKQKNYYRLAHIEIDSILKNDLAGMKLRAGDTIVIRIGPKKPRHSLSFSFDKGDNGIWLFNYSNGSFGIHGPDDLMPIGQLSAVKRIITELDAVYKKALVTEIPTKRTKRREILALPPLTPKEIDIAIAKGVPQGVDIQSLRVVNTHKNPMQTLFLDQQGNVVGGLPYYANDMQFSDGLLPVSMAVEKGIYSKFNYVDRNGTLILKVPYSSAQGFSEGLAVIEIKNRFGYIDTSGKLVIPCVYDQATPFSDGMARVVQANTAFLIDKAGKVILEGKRNQILSLNDGLACVNIQAQTIGYIDNTGKLALDTKGRNYVAEKPFTGGLSKVWVRQTQPVHHGFINREGSLVFQPKPWVFGDCSEGVIPFTKHHGRSSKWGYMDKTGKVVIAPRFIRADSYSDGVATVTYTDWIKRPKVVSVDTSVKLSPQAAEYLQGSKQGYIDLKGEIISPIGFDSASPFVKGFARVRIFCGRGKTFDGVINKKGKVVLVLSSPGGK